MCGQSAVQHSSHVPQLNTTSNSNPNTQPHHQASHTVDLTVFEGVTRAEAMVGRKVKRYWPDDAAKNKGVRGVRGGCVITQ